MSTGASSPEVTVVTATYHWPAALREAMASVLDQTYTDFEYLVIGDACTDETEALVASFDDSRIRWHNLPLNTGNQSGVNQVALQMARGRYIAYLNHDDLWFPHHLQSLLAPLKSHRLDIVNGLALSIKPPGHSYRNLLGMPQLTAAGQVVLAPMTSSVMHTRKAACEAGGWIDWRETEHIPTQDFFRRLRDLRGAFATVHDVTSLKFHSGDRLNSYVEKSAAEQVFYREKMRIDPELRYREVMKAMAFRNMREDNLQIPLPERPDNAPKGWLIDQWRINRGLASMLDVHDQARPRDLPAEATRWVKVQTDDSTLVLNNARVAAACAEPAKPASRLRWELQRMGRKARRIVRRAALRLGPDRPRIP